MCECTLQTTNDEYCFALTAEQVALLKRLFNEGLLDIEGMIIAKDKPTFEEKFEKI